MSCNMAMTIESNCDHGDYSSGENLITEFGVTINKGVSVKSLKTTELAKSNSMFRLHLHTHPGHSAIYSFSVPDGYEIRDNIIYKSET